jgi:hypothetical protein
MAPNNPHPQEAVMFRRGAGENDAWEARPGATGIEGHEDL